MRNRLKEQNILACAILAVALYLNFIYKDSSIADFTSSNTQKSFTAVDQTLWNEISVTSINENPLPAFNSKK